MGYEHFNEKTKYEREAKFREGRGLFARRHSEHKCTAMSTIVVNMINSKTNDFINDSQIRIMYQRI